MTMVVQLPLPSAGPCAFLVFVSRRPPQQPLTATVQGKSLAAVALCRPHGSLDPGMCGICGQVLSSRSSSPSARIAPNGVTLSAGASAMSLVTHDASPDHVPWCRGHVSHTERDTLHGGCCQASRGHWSRHELTPHHTTGKSPSAGQEDPFPIGKLSFSRFSEPLCKP
ncbi:uncharacterized protein B0I36DRAFT_345861 [Microdochium trichocladiopsis]|uniref:Uncharacterized protein n=1 Tax=Microdochium trichocladiopsis TaxID=1682393 RepID=A0A9P9BY81_9PEZI|nr:uncharacterized protein B0I36DRAFT_345861 [Microdochium trichocladiopsis]KAH7037798.1 hypothetical protein B0I36DRAFT_345861 [Microdochium trichocladiopsis]